MYYPIGWHKVLKLDTQCGDEQCGVLSIQANHEQELFLILTTKSLHVWCPRPSVEIACHKRSNESIDAIGLNRSAIWRTDSSVIVIATDRDQLLYYRICRRSASASSTFLTGASRDVDSIYRLHGGAKDLKTVLNRDMDKEISELFSSESDSIPALTLFTFGKLDLSSVGVSCLLSAEEELIVGARNGDFYGVHWDGNVDEKFPWSLSKEPEKGADFLIDIKFSSILNGFAFVFNSGRVAFRPSKDYIDKNLNNNDSEGSATNGFCQPRLSFLPNVMDATCVEINHKYRLVAFGTRNSKVLVCSLSSANQTLSINHELDIPSSRFPHSRAELGAVKCLKYSPDSFALAVSWEGCDFAIWSVFGSLLFFSQQWQSDVRAPRSIRVTSLAWGREGYSLWISTPRESNDNDDIESIISNIPSISDVTRYAESEYDGLGASASLDLAPRDEVIIMSLVHSNLTSSPHLTCSSDTIILLTEERIYVGPSIPHKAEFDHWCVIDIVPQYLASSFPIRYATVDRESKNLAVSGNQGFALYSIESKKWKLFSKKSHEESFSVCGDLMWWRDYVILSCYNFIKETFELRAYLSTEELSNDRAVIQVISMEIIRMSIFENKLLVLYCNGTLGMFILNLRNKPNFRKVKSLSHSTAKSSNSTENADRSDAKDDASANNNHENPNNHIRSDSITSSNPSGPVSMMMDFSLHISPIENLVISNLQANAHCISSIALTRLHFKNNRYDDSILLNSCGKLFLLEREVPLTSRGSELSSPELNDLSLDSHKSSEYDSRVNSAKKLSNSSHFASALLTDMSETTEALSNVTFKAVSVIASNVEQFWISPEISSACDLSYFKQSLWLSCGGSENRLQVWLPLLNDKNDPPMDLYIPDRIMLPIKCDIYPLAIRSSAPDVLEPDDAIVLGAESDILYQDNKLFASIPYCAVKRQCRVYLHRILRELLLNQHLGYYARKIAESCQSLPYFSHCFELLLHEVLEEEATSPVPLPDPMLPQVVKFIKEFPVYLDTVVHCARKSELSMWSYLFDERAVGDPRRLFQECLSKNKLDTAASCLIILQSLDRNTVSHRMVKELIRAARQDEKYEYLIQDLESFITRAELEYISESSGSPQSRRSGASP